MASSSSDSGRVSRRTDGILGSAQTGNSPREEPFRNYSGWNCIRCNSTNTIIEAYDHSLEGYCMSCARYQDIPKEKLRAYYESNPSSARRKIVLQVSRKKTLQTQYPGCWEGEFKGYGRRAGAQ